MHTFTELSAKLARIDLVPQSLTGFENFITSYVYRNGNNTFLIDIGPATTAPDLLLALKELGVTQVDYIFLTHIHLDHAGAAGHLAQAFPKTPIICHPKGLKHLHQPQKLWQGSLAVLKDFAVAYGEPQPVPAAQLMSADDFELAGLDIIKTPGHATHHLSFASADCLFIGEAAGVFFNLGFGYLRPATPPRFAMDLALQSLELLEQREPRFTAFAHYGVSENGLEQVRQAQTQLALWAQTAENIILNGGGNMADCIDVLLQTDPLLRNFDMFNAKEQQRERDFFVNALLGITDWLKDCL